MIAQSYLYYSLLLIIIILIVAGQCSEFVIRAFEGYSEYSLNPFPNLYNFENYIGKRYRFVMFSRDFMGFSQMCVFSGQGYTFQSVSTLQNVVMNDIWCVRSNSSIYPRIETISISPQLVPNAFSSFGTVENVYHVSNYFGSRRDSGGFLVNHEEMLIIGGLGNSNVSNGYLCDVFVVNMTSSLQKYLKFYPPNVLPFAGTRNVSSVLNNIGGRAGFNLIPFSDNVAFLFVCYIFSVGF